MAKEKVTEEKDTAIPYPEEALQKAGEVVSLVQSKHSFIHVTTHDETYFILVLLSKIQQMYHNKECPNIQTMIWSISQGMLSVGEWENSETVIKSKTWKDSHKLNVVLQQIVESNHDAPQIFIMRDLNLLLGPPIPRVLKDMYDHLNKTHKTIIMLSGELNHSAGGSVKDGVEPTLDKYISVLNFGLPSYQEINSYVTKVVAQAAKKEDKSIKCDYDATHIHEATRSLQGLTITEGIRSLRTVLCTKKELDIRALLEQKKEIITKGGILDYIDTKEDMSSIGGMDNLKDFIARNKGSHSQEAEEFGVEPLKGILLVGIPGAGKSLSAKALGNDWKVPTLRLDIGRVMSSLVGSSESRMRDAIAQASAVSPAVLWVDEIEKGMSGTRSSDKSDGGTMARVFGTLLTAMQEGMKGLTVVATANSIEQLPPELIRRFDEVFYVDLPTFSERKEIFKIHIVKRKRELKGLDLNKLCKASAKFTGAEIEKVIKESITYCFSNGKCKLSTDIVLQRINDTKPIASIMKEPIDKIREWANNRARYASSEAYKEATGVTGPVTETGKHLMSLDDNDDERDSKEEGEKKPADPKDPTFFSF